MKTSFLKVPLQHELSFGSTLFIAINNKTNIFRDHNEKSNAMKIKAGVYVVKKLCKIESKSITLI